MSGFVGHPEIWTLMKMSSVGLAPYKSTPSFVASLPNKVGEYLSVGLPIISSLKGSLEHLLDKNQCGITYSNCDDQELAAILYDLHENRTKLDDMAAKVGRVFRENFFAERVYGNMIVNLEFISKQHNISV
jgi:glycosyltransferase involved in cell wall biosynthesis